MTPAKPSAPETAHTQSETPLGYAIGHITVKDLEKWAHYCSMVPGTLSAWGGEIVFRGKKTAVLNGSHPHMLTVVLKFPDVQALTNWHASAAYQAIVPLRDAAADVVLLGFES